jgi:hypothetical protein
MATQNPITGDYIKTSYNSKEYADNFDKIFGEKKKKDDSDYWEKLRLETEEKLKS